MAGPTNTTNDLLTQLLYKLENLGIANSPQHPFALNGGPTLVPSIHGPTGGPPGANSHLNNSVNSLSENFNTCMYPSVSVGDGHSIPVTNTGHSILKTSVRPLYLNNVLITPHIVKNLISVRQFIRDNNCTIKFDAFGFSVKDSMTRRVLLRCDSTGDLYPVTHSSIIPRAFLVSQHTWHQRLGHPGGDVLCRLVSNNVISCYNEKPLVLCHACQLGKHVRLPFVSSNTVVSLVSPLLKSYRVVFSDLNWQNAMRDEYHAQGTNTAYLLLYVDDIVLTASSEGLLQRIIRSLHQEFAMTNLGLINYFMGISITRDSSGLFLSQKKYAVEILEKAHMVNCNPSWTPVDTESKLGVDRDLVSDLTLYRSLAGSLQYLTFTRPATGLSSYA
ncbi:ribonuclease H-like domain-containing protein [Tanacetum coccineum]